MLKPPLKHCVQKPNLSGMKMNWCCRLLDLSTGTLILMFLLYLLSSQIPLCELNANFSTVSLWCLLLFFFLYNMMMMTLGQGNGAAGCVFLCSCPLSKYKAVLASSFPLSSTLCSAGCTLIRHMSVSLMSKIYTLGSILFGSSLFWLLSKHNYVVIITLFHAAQDLLKCNAL